jgi:hypothetical protein
VRNTNERDHLDEACLVSEKSMMIFGLLSAELKFPKENEALMGIVRSRRRSTGESENPSERGSSKLKITCGPFVLSAEKIKYLLGG